MPTEVRSALKFHFVENVDEVLKLALGLEVEAPKVVAKTLSPARGQFAA